MMTPAAANDDQPGSRRPSLQDELRAIDGEEAELRAQIAAHEAAIRELDARLAGRGIVVLAAHR